MPGTLSSRPFRSIVIATDFSQGARAAITRLARVPVASTARLRFVHVVPLPTLTPLAVAKRMARERLNRVAARVRTRFPAARVRIEVAAGRPADELARIAKEQGAELIVAGRRGAGGFPRLLLGSTVERLARLAPVPLLIVANAPGRHAHALFALDTVDETSPVIRAGLRLLAERTTVEILHVYWAYGEGYLRLGGASPALVRQHRRRVREQASESLDGARRAFAEAGYDATVLLVNGDPRRLVPRFVRGHRADLVVIGNHARNAVARALLGSVAQEVLRESTCDVLLVPVP